MPEGEPRFHVEEVHPPLASEACCVGHDSAQLADDLLEREDELLPRARPGRRLQRETGTNSYPF